MPTVPVHCVTAGVGGMVERVQRDLESSNIHRGSSGEMFRATSKKSTRILESERSEWLKNCSLKPPLDSMQERSFLNSIKGGSNHATDDYQDIGHIFRRKG